MSNCVYTCLMHFKMLRTIFLQSNCTRRPVLAAIPTSLASIRFLTLYVPSVWLQTVFVHLFTLTFLHFIQFIAQEVIDIVRHQKDIRVHL